jgi:hypothetical protein
VQLGIVEAFVFDEAVVFVSEVVVVFEFFFGDDFEELGVDGVRIAERLDRRERG